MTCDKSSMLYGGMACAGTNAHILTDAGNAGSIGVMMPGEHLPWRRSRRWVAPAPSAWLLRAVIPQRAEAANSLMRIECHLRSPRMAWMHDWQVLGHAVLPFSCCGAIAAAGAAVHLHSGAAKTPARAALRACVMPAQARLLPTRSVVLIEIAGSGALQLHMPSPAAEGDSTLFHCEAARLRRCTPPTTNGQRHARSGGDLARTLVASSPQAANEAMAVTYIDGGQHQDRSTWAAAQLSAAETSYRLTSAHAACTQVSAAACTVAEQSERDGICSATAALCGSTSVVTAAASLDCLAVVSDATMLPTAAHPQLDDPMRPPPCATLGAGLRFTMQWQANSSPMDTRRASTTNTEDGVKVSLTAPKRSLAVAEPLAMAARTLAVVQTASARGAACQAALAPHPPLLAGATPSAAHGTGLAAVGGLMRAAAAEDHDSIRVGAPRSEVGTADSRVHATLALQARQVPVSQGISMHHPLDYPAQRASVAYRPLLLPLDDRTADVPRQTTSQPAVVPSHARAAGATVIVGGLGGVGLEMTQFRA